MSDLLVRRPVSCSGCTTVISSCLETPLLVSGPVTRTIFGPPCGPEFSATITRTAEEEFACAVIAANTPYVGNSPLDPNFCRNRREYQYRRSLECNDPRRIIEDRWEGLRGTDCPVVGQPFRRGGFGSCCRDPRVINEDSSENI